jgi:hypothetical protein
LKKFKKFKKLKKSKWRPVKKVRQQRGLQTPALKNQKVNFWTSALAPWGTSPPAGQWAVNSNPAMVKGAIFKKIWAERFFLTTAPYPVEIRSHDS